MARIRSIKPEFFLHEGLAELSPLHRLFFVGLWTLADKHGRLEDRPKRIKAALMPWEDCDVEELLGELDRQDFIHRYEADGVCCISIPGFQKHQRPHPKEAGFELPNPPSREKKRLAVKRFSTIPSCPPGKEIFENGGGKEILDLAATPLEQALTAPPLAAPPPPAPPVDAVSAPGALRVPAISAGAMPERRSEARDGPTTLRDRMEALWLAKKLKPYRWRTADDNAVRGLLAFAHDDWGEIERRWVLALARTRFPTCSSVAELEKHWNAYATDEPKPESRGRAPESAKYREGVTIDEAPF